MMDEDIRQWERNDQIRRKSVDKEKSRSLIESSVTTMSIVKSVPLNECSAIVIFRETYESIRQLGDARWWLRGYEPRNHEVSMEVLRDLEIKEKTRLCHLGRFKAIRNDANYRGFKVTVGQAKEILEFWDACSQEIISALQEGLRKNP